MKISGWIKLPAKWMLVALWILPAFSLAQLTDTMWIDIQSIRFSKTINRKCLFASVPREPLDGTVIAALAWQNNKLASFHPNVPLELMERTSLISFGLYNSSDTAREIYFTPGFYFRNLSVFKSTPDPDSSKLIRQLPESSIHTDLYPGARLLKLQPHERAQFYASFDLIRTNANNFVPYLIEKDYMRQWVTAIKYRGGLLDTITYVITGVLLLMIFYSLAVYLQNRNPEFVYYSAYAMFSAVLLFLKSFLVGDNGGFNFFYEEYLDFIILGAGVYFYIFFMRQFLNTKADHPFLEKLFRISNWTLVILLAIFSYIYFFTTQYISLYVLENYIIKIFMFLIGGVFIVYGILKRDKLLNYLTAGNAALLLFSIISLLSLLGFKMYPANRFSILNKGLFYYEMGIALELMFFLSGLAYKNRRDLIERVKERERLKLDNERQEFEKQMAVMSAMQGERDRISADMHDELGSGMTAIRLMSEIAKTKMKDQPMTELEKISNSANDLLGKMNTIIWTMKSSNDTLESLVAYLRANALEYFDGTAVNCHVSVPDIVPPTEMSGEKRRNIFLSVKESMNNVLKHAHASDVYMTITVKGSNLVIEVLDNGQGIDTEKLRRFGNGLSNMKRRMETIGGSFSAETGNGSKITFTAPV